MANSNLTSDQGASALFQSLLSDIEEHGCGTCLRKAMILRDAYSAAFKRIAELESELERALIPPPEQQENHSG